MRRIGSALALASLAVLTLAPAGAQAAAAPTAGRSWEVVTGLNVPLPGGEWEGNWGALGFVTADDGSVRQTNLPGYTVTALAYSPDARTVYSFGTFVDDLGGTVGGFAAFDASTGEMIWQDASVGSPRSLAVSPDGSVVMLPHARGDVATRAFERFDGCTGDATSAAAVAFAPDGGTVWLLCAGTRFNPISELRAFDATTLDPVRTIPLADHYARALVLTPDGSTAVLSGEVGRTVEESGVPAVTRLDLTTGEITDLRLDLDLSYGALAMAPDGAYVYTLAGVGDVTAELTSVDITSMTVTTSTPFPYETGDLAVAPDGSRVYSATRSTPAGSETPLVSAHDAGTLATLSQSPFEASGLLGLAVTPDQAPIARLTASEPNSPVTFDASGSTVEFGSIAEYAWDFGDGTTLVTSTPVVEHEYTQPGEYTASVRLTSSGGTSTEDVYTGQQLLRNGDPSAIATVTVTVPAAPAPGVSAELPPTGFDSSGFGGAGFAVAAAALVIAGGIAVGLGRRRGRQP
ncbi:PKD domain-containing protein [Agromyces larvae]|uniref:PKD domain-containing protein n=1 Tax=Agromyces larvae TaxID=2929802 RepID=A0ABY4BV73_9MICO|nr:PKD domain-containing protein [Agromyces larvae]UOE43117.1 PKD domain-containing protein [Agromyces larvae]